VEKLAQKYHALPSAKLVETSNGKALAVLDAALDVTPRKPPNHAANTVKKQLSFIDPFSPLGHIETSCVKVF
jgi:hypothetical protein